MIKQFSITRADIALIAVLVFVNLTLFWQWQPFGQEGRYVVVEVEQKEVGRWPLHQDFHHEVQGPLGATGIEIKNGQVRIDHSPCKNKVCIKGGFIRHAHQMAVCVPNRVVVRILGDQSLNVDAVVG